MTGNGGRLLDQIQPRRLIERVDLDASAADGRVCTVPFEELVGGRRPARNKCKLEHRPVGLPRIELVEADGFDPTA